MDIPKGATAFARLTRRGRRSEWFAITLPAPGTPERDAWPKAAPSKVWPKACPHRLHLGDFLGGFQCVRRNGHRGRHCATSAPDHVVVAVWRSDRPVQADRNPWRELPLGFTTFRGRVTS